METTLEVLTDRIVHKTTTPIWTEDYLDKRLVELTHKEKILLVMMLRELDDARRKHPDWPEDIIHQAAIIGEESGELLQAAINHHYEREPLVCVAEEAVHTAATCFRLLLRMPI